MTAIISGVYVITNSVNGHRYIGSSANMPKREKVHFAYLRKGEHHNAHLQNAYNKYGGENFRFQVLEYCANSSLTEREQYYIDSLRPEYNVRLTADSNLGLKRSEEARQKMSVARMGVSPANKGVSRSEETRRKISETKKGCTPWNKGKTGVYSKEHLQKMSEVQKGKKLSEETRRKMSKVRKGKKVSEETRRKMSASRKAKSLLKRFLQKISGN